MNAVEIEEAVSQLAATPFDPAAFPLAFLEAFGNKETTLKRLRVGNTNQSDLDGLLQRGNIHFKVAQPGQVAETLAALRESPATAKQKVKFILATDGVDLHAEQLIGDVPPLACAFKDLPDHFAFFLPLAGITTVRAIAENAFDIRATGRLNRLYVELLKTNPDWDTNERREDLNHFFARLIFCFFAEDTGIFDGMRLFTDTVERMSERDGSNTGWVLAECFRTMNTAREVRAESDLRPWAMKFPYVNGNLFSGSVETPKFSKIARSYLLFVGGLDWKLINPDIFGSMIQAVADDEERGALGMHYTSVPNILKVLNPLFLDDLRQKLAEAGDGSTPASKGQLKRLRDRMARIRVFDPACGSGNFLVIAYIEMRKIEAIINERRGEREVPSAIPIRNFFGIEIRGFAAEIARLALIIGKFQCDAVHIGDLFARKQVLPLDKENWITKGNALQLDWIKICPPGGTGVKVERTEDRLFAEKLDQAEIDFETVGLETFICGNPPYKGNARKSAEQKEDLKALFDGQFEKWGLLDYVCAWFFKATEYAERTSARFAFVATNSIAQGQHVSNFWKPLFEKGLRFCFAVRSFKWSNLAAHDAGVTVVIIGAGLDVRRGIIYDGDTQLLAENINAYLLPQDNHWVTAVSSPLSSVPAMVKGNYYGLSEHLLLNLESKDEFASQGFPVDQLKRFYGSTEVINAKPRYCFWFEQEPEANLLTIGNLAERIVAGVKERAKSKDAIANGMVKRPHQFREMNRAENRFLAIPVVSSDNRDYLPVDLLDRSCVISNKCFGLYDAPLWTMALVVSLLHCIWIKTVCVRLRTDPSYSNTLGWNTFSVPVLSDQNKADLTRCTQEILLAREAHFPATIADLYDPEQMPADLRAAHDRNDETLERIYIGRRFKNDTERLEKLFELYTQMTAKAAKVEPAKRKKKGA